MFEELFELGKASKYRLLEIIDSYDFLEDGELYLSSIICHPECDDEVLKALIQKSDAPLEALDNDMLDFIAYKEITSLEVIFLAMKRFENHKLFIASIKQNPCYLKFKEQGCFLNVDRSASCEGEQVKAAPVARNPRYRYNYS